MQRAGLPSVGPRGLEIMGVLDGTSGLSGSKIALLSGVPRNGIFIVIKRLIDAGLVAVESIEYGRPGRPCSKYSLTQYGLAILAAYVEAGRQAELAREKYL